MLNSIFCQRTENKYLTNIKFQIKLAIACRYYLYVSLSLVFMVSYHFQLMYIDLYLLLLLQNWSTSPSLIIARGGKLGSQLIASKLAFVLEVLTIARVVLNYIHQIPNFWTKFTTTLKNSFEI